MLKKSTMVAAERDYARYSTASVRSSDANQLVF